MPKKNIDRWAKRKACEFMSRHHGAIRWTLSKRIPSLSNPKVSFAFFCFNMIKQRGEQWVRDSFNTMKGQSNDIMVIDYDSEDNIKELTEEYGFSYHNVKKVSEVPYHMAKCNNLAVKRAKHDIFVRLCPDIIYPQNFAQYISAFFEVNDPKKVFLFFKMFDLWENGDVMGRPGWEMTFYRPYLLKCRGWDERTSYYAGEDRYGRWIMERIFGCRAYVPPYYFLMHRRHVFKNPYKVNPSKITKVLGKIKIENQIETLSRDIRKAKKIVKNSYF